jgi:hypothetical protein
MVASVYACAYDVADLRRLCVELGLMSVSASEVRNYWSSCWGNAMRGIEPERGIWIAYGHSERPERMTARPTPEAK